MRLGKLRISVSPGAVLLFGAAFFLDESGMLPALFPVVLIHELGHLAALKLCGARVTGLSASVSGLAIDYALGNSEGYGLFIALSGPVAGLTLAPLCAGLAAETGSPWLYMCAGLGLLVNLFNLLPSPPLDGGRALRALLSHVTRARADRLSFCFSLITNLTLVTAGAYFAVTGRGAALLLAGLYLSAFGIMAIVKSHTVV